VSGRGGLVHEKTPGTRGSYRPLGGVWGSNGCKRGLTRHKVPARVHVFRLLQKKRSRNWGITAEGDPCAGQSIGGAIVEDVLMVPAAEGQAKYALKRAPGTKSSITGEKAAGKMRKVNLGGGDQATKCFEYPSREGIQIRKHRKSGGVFSDSAMLEIRVRFGQEKNCQEDKD